MDNYSIVSVPNQDAEKFSLIEIKGELSIKYIHDIKTKLDQLIRGLDTVEILVSEASVIDLSLMQYFLSLKKTEKTATKTIRISFDIDTDLKELLENAGFKNIENLKE